MIEAKDTVMSVLEMDDALNTIPTHQTTKRTQSERFFVIAKAQAEISFKAGKRLVVEWVEENDFYGGDDPCSMMVEQDRWQAQKKYGSMKKYRPDPIEEMEFLYYGY